MNIFKNLLLSLTFALCFANCFGMEWEDIAIENPQETININFFDQLPDEVLSEILSSNELSLQESYQLYSVNHRIKNILKNAPLKINVSNFHTEILSGGYNIFNDQNLELLVKQYKNIQSLNLANSYYITDKAIEILSKNCPNITSLNLNNCPKITKEGLLKIPSNLTHLGLSRSELTDTELIILAERNPKLTSLDLSWTKITPQGLAILTTKCPNLIELDLTLCRNLTDDTIKVLPISLKNLNLTEVNITNKALENLPKRCPNLVNLNLCNCQIKSFEEISKILEECHKLESLDLNNCHELTLTYEQYEKLIQKFRLLKLKYWNLAYCEKVNKYPRRNVWSPFNY